ncbi:MAG TPA: glycosyltransferase family 2 protein [Natronosporangium sp.]
MLVSIGLPVRNGESRLVPTVESVLGQDHPDIELVISDNASTDGTEELCRELAKADSRIVYHRQPHNVGLLNNFITTIRLASGEFFRWIGDSDALEPKYVTRCLEAFEADPRRILVTTQIAYQEPDGTVRTGEYHGTDLASHDPVIRFREILRLLNQSFLTIDPLYGLLRREPVAALPRVNMYCEDQVFAARLALTGPWGHVPEVLARRVRDDREPRGQVTAKLGVPRWQAHAAHALFCRDVLRHLRTSDLDPAQRRRARLALARFYAVRHQRVAARRLRRLLSYAGAPGRRR